MSPALRAFLGELIDYAGTFPPAQLGLEEALATYARHRSGPHSWMLGRYIATTTAFAGVEADIDSLSSPGSPLPLVVVGRSDNLSSTLEEIASLSRRRGGRISVDALELKLGEGDCEDDALGPILDSIDANLPCATRVFLELPAPGGEPRPLDWLVSSLAERNVVVGGRGEVATRFGFKLRCGGAAPAHVPSSERVARALAACRDADVPFKATAGLHQPLRGRVSAIGETEHGFVNVFAAGILGRALSLPEETIVEVLDERSPSAFQFEDSLEWREHSVDAAMIGKLRESAVGSFGSCSFEEPIEGLAEAGFVLGEEGA